MLARLAGLPYWNKMTKVSDLGQLLSASSFLGKRSEASVARSSVWR